MERFKLPAQVLGLIGVLFVFFVSLELMGESFKLMGRGAAQAHLSSNIVFVTFPASVSNRYRYIPEV